MSPSSLVRGSFIFMVCLLVACGSDDAEQTPNNAETPSLDGVSLQTLSVEPFEAVELTGVPDSLGTEQLYATYTITDGPTATEQENLTVVQRLEDRVVVYAPFLFTDQAGQVELKITDGETSSEPFTLDIAAVEGVQDGAFANGVAELEDVFEKLVRSYGMTLDELDSVRAQSEIPARFAPLINLQWSLVHPDNPQSLVSLAGDQEVAPMLDIIATAMGMPAQLRAANDAFEPAELVDLTPGGPTMAVRVLDPPYSIDSAESLAELLRRYDQARSTAQSLKLFSDIAGVYMTIVAIGTAGVGGVAVGAAVKITEAVVALVGSSSEAVRAASWALPCCMTDVSAATTRFVLNEDQPPPAVTLQDVTATVRTEEVDITKEMVSQAKKKISGKVAGKVKDKYGEQAEKASQKTLVDPALNKLGDSLGLEGSTMYMEWRNVPLLPTSGARNGWVSAEATPFSTEPLILDPTGVWGQWQLNEKAFDTTRAIIRVIPDSDRYKVTSIARLPSDSFQVDVAHIRVSISPQSARVQERGDELTFTVTVENAVDTSILPIEFSAGEIISSPTEIDDGVFEFVWKSPAEPEKYPVLITAESASELGIRSSPAAPARLGEATVTDRDLVYVEATGCMEFGETRTIQGTVIPEDAGLDWTASAGSVAASGASNATFTAPGQEGTVTITATSKANADESDSIAVTVRENCNCTYTIRVPQIGTFTGTEAALTVQEGMNVLSLTGGDQPELFFNSTMGDGVEIPTEPGTSGTFTAPITIMNPFPPPTTPGAYSVSIGAERLSANISWDGEFDATLVMSGLANVAEVVGETSNEFQVPIQVEIKPRVDRLTSSNTFRQGDCSGELRNESGM